MLLRGLGGVALRDVDQADHEDKCGYGPYPLLSTIYTTFTEVGQITGGLELYCVARLSFVTGPMT